MRMVQKNKLLLLSTAVIATAVIAAPMAEASSYSVGKGDTLTKIAAANKTTVNQLKQWNNLKNDYIYVGQKLTVSAVKQPAASNTQVTASSKPTAATSNKPTSSQTPAATNPSTYKVVKGDTLSKIAKAVKATVADIKKWNGLSSDAIYIGQQLKIGEVKAAAPTAPAQQATPNKEVPSNAPASEPVANLQSYQVLKGDSLSKIATKFGLTVAGLKNLNQLNSDLIYIGQVLKVTDASEQGEPEVILDSKEIIKSNQVIDAKLSEEKAINTNVTVSGQAIYAKVLNIADSLTGTPYVFAGNTPAGFDCSGFVKYVFSNAGLDIARKSSNDYFMKDTTVVDNPVPGDVIFFKNTYVEGISHMGIYIGDGQFIHAGSNGVEVSKLSYDYWASKFVAFKRFNQVK